jgi:hypothetical protein
MYRESGRPVFRTGSIVMVYDVRVTPRYGDGIGAGAYHRVDRNGFSLAEAKDAKRGARKGTLKRKPGPKVRVWREQRESVERFIAGTIRMGDVD